MHILIIILSTLSLNLFSASINIPINNNLSQEPAGDLIYEGKQISSAKAIELIESGFDISKLNPKVSNLFSNKKLNINELPSLKNNNEFTYITTKSSPTEIFRFTAKNNLNQNVVLTASLDNHTNIIRALILRLIGFDINRPSLNKKTLIHFKDSKQKESFLVNLSEQTLSSRSRWIESETDKSVVLRHLLLDVSELKNVNLYLPVMSEARQKERRVFRSLLALYTITDFKESLNITSWTVGKIFNKQLGLSHPYARKFKNTTIDDIKWMLRKLNSITRNEFQQIITQSNYPYEVKQLVVEKLISRIVDLSKRLRLPVNLSANTNLTNEYVYQGKLKDIDFKESAIKYSNKDVPSPYKFKDIFRLFKTQAIYSGLSSVLDSAFERYVPGKYTQEAGEDIREQISEYRQENPGNNGNLPLKVFSSPTAYGRLFATRNIVFGQVLDTNAPIQLVDSIGAEVNLGMQGRLTGITNTITPNLGINASVVRTYSHVRAMPDLKTATSTDVSNILIPRMMKKLGRILKDEYTCSIPQYPVVEEREVSGQIFFSIKYDQKDPKYKKEAFILREKLITDGTSASKILVLKYNRDEECIDKVKEDRDLSVTAFLKSFADNETFVISDSLRVNGSVNVPITLFPNANLNIGSDSAKSLIRSVIVKKIDESIQVTIQEQNDKSVSLSQSFSFFINLASNSNLFLQGKLNAKFYKVNLEESDETKKQRAIRVIRDLFIRNDKDELYTYYKGEKLEHNVRVRLNTLKLLWFKKDKFKMNHDLAVILPEKENSRFTLKQRTRTFYQALDYKRKGSDFQTFTNNILNFFSKVITLGQTSLDPGSTFLGKSQKLYFATEAETTKGFDNSATTRIEIIRSGWNRRSEKTHKYLDEVDELFQSTKEYNPVSREILIGSSKLKSYDIRSTIILYPSALKSMQNKLLLKSRSLQIRTLGYLYNKEGINRIKVKGKKLLNLLSLLDKSFIDTKEKVRNINSLYKFLFNRFDRSRVLELIGEENFFASTRVTGFLEDHHEGGISYTADTVGTYNQNIGTGILDKISSKIGITSYQLRALNYSPGL